MSTWPATAAVCLASCLLIAVGTADIFWHVPAGLLVLAGFAVYGSTMWTLAVCVQTAVSRAIRSYLVGSELEESFTAGAPDTQHDVPASKGPLTLVPPH